jgi:hypothetical protein
MNGQAQSASGIMEEINSAVFLSWLLLFTYVLRYGGTIDATERVHNRKWITWCVTNGGAEGFPQK